MFAAAITGCVVGPVTASVAAWQVACLVGWDAGALVFLVWVWRTIGGLDPEHTAHLANREDPTAAVADSVIVFSGLACLGSVGLILIKASSTPGAGKALLIALGVASVGLSWASLHTVFTLRYARAYYFGGGAGGIDFNEETPPDYRDFAYVAFTIGLTFQVSDTDLSSKPIRRLALRHALLSFLFGAVIIGLTINVVASLLH